MFLCVLKRASVLAVFLVSSCGDIDKRDENINAGFAGQFQVGAVQSGSLLEVSTERGTGAGSEDIVE